MFECVALRLFPTPPEPPSRHDQPPCQAHPYAAESASFHRVAAFFRFSQRRTETSTWRVEPQQVDSPCAAVRDPAMVSRSSEAAMTSTIVLPFQPDAMTPAQLAAVSYLARDAGQTHRPPEGLDPRTRESSDGGFVGGKTLCCCRNGGTNYFQACRAACYSGTCSYWAWHLCVNMMGSVYVIRTISYCCSDVYTRRNTKSHMLTPL